MKSEDALKVGDTVELLGVREPFTGKIIRVFPPAMRNRVDTSYEIDGFPYLMPHRNVRLIAALNAVPSAEQKEKE